MKIVELCGKGHCPVVKLDGERVEIGEKGNLCVLTAKEWEVLKQKVLSGEI
ncbi:MAG: hypothetical protein HYX79_09430 [Chloroflexi bacterium]|nr:hypothetical protein [Chloroflexota bacterium]